MTAGAVDGYARFSRTEDRWDGNRPANVVTLDELHALTADAYATLWRFLAEMDWVGTVKAPRRAREERLPWLLADARDAQLADVTDGLWVRLFDVAAALAARTYEREGGIGHRGRRSASAPKAATGCASTPAPTAPTCVETTETAELTVPVEALGAAYLGGPSLRLAVLAGGADEHRDGGARSARRHAADARRALDVDVLLGRGSCHIPTAPPTMMAAWTRCHRRRCSPGTRRRCATSPSGCADRPSRAARRRRSRPARLAADRL